jgi:F420-dependent oxidoreductase-like protein
MHGAYCTVSKRRVAMHVGIMIEGQEGLTWERWWRLASAAEDLGFESLCRSDHLTGLGGDSKRPSLETWVSLTALASRTRRIRFGPMVSPLTFYHPAILAKMAAAVDTLSGGRFDLGIGAGWNEHEHAMFGIPFPPLKERMDRLECGARAIRALDAGKPVTLAQPYYPLKNAESYPRPAGGRTRLLIGGRGEKRTLRIVAEFADEWNVTRVDAAGYPAKREVLAGHCKAVGRNPESIRRSLMIPLAIGRDTAEVARRVAAARAVFPALPDGEAAWRAVGFLAGPPAQVLADLDRWKAAGMQRVLLQMLDQEDIGALELFARDVLPRL